MRSALMTRKCCVLCFAGCLWAGLNFSPLAVAQDLATELLFAEGLQGRGYLDLAEKHLDSLAAETWAVTDKAAIQYTFAELLEKMAEQVLKKEEIPMLDRLALREGYLSKAEGCWRAGLKLNPAHEKAPNARFAIGTLLKLRAQNKKRNWEKLEDELDRIGDPLDPKNLDADGKAEEAKKEARRQEYKRLIDKEKKEALALLKESVQYFTEMAKGKEKVEKDCQDQRQKERRPDMLDKLQKQEEKAQEERVQACFEWYSNLIFLAEVVGPETQDGAKYLQEAVKSLKALSGEFPNWLVSKYAIMLEGYGHCLLKNYAVGFKRFDENIGEEDAEALQDVIQKTHYRFADCARKADPKTYPKDYPPKNQLIVYMVEGLVYRVTAEEAKQKIGLKEIGARYGRTGEVLMKLNKKRTYTVEAGEKLIIYQGLFSRFEGLEQEPIGKAATLLLAEACVNWGLEMRGMKQQPKEWRTKVRTGLAYAEKVAQGEEPWAYKANTLLAKWSDLMKEVKYISPVQVYARATTAFFEANKVPKAQQRPLYEDAIYYFQMVIELSGGEAESEGAKSALDDEKIADSWFKMGASYYVLKRVPEAALCWNACARNFPKDSKSEKAADLSTSVMGQVYRAAKEAKEDWKTVGCFYADMLADFVRLYPENQKAANAQFFLAEVYRAREDYLGAANAYEKVPAISQYYDQAFQLIGICYLNCFHSLFQASKGETEEAKSVLLKASESIERFIRWVEEEGGPNEETAQKRRELQAKAALNRAKIYLYPVMKDPDRTIKLLEGYEEKYQSLPEKVKADLFPDAIFTRLKASVMKEELPGAIKELDRLLDKYPKSPDVVEAFKYVAGVYMKEADKRDKEIEGLKKEIEAGPAKADELKKAGKTEEAAALEKGLKDSKDKVTALDGEAGGFRVKAADLYHKLIAKAPKQDCSIYLFSADTYFVNRVYDKAAEMYGRFLATCERDPKFVDKIIEIKSRLGESLYHLRDYEKALQFLSVVEASYTDKAKRFSIRPMINHCSKAIALKLMKDPKKKDEAAKHFTNALNGWAVLKNSIQPLTEEWWEATYEIGDILYWTAGYDKALGHLGSHILMYPQMGGANWKPKFLDLGKRLKEKLKKPTDVQRIDDIIGKLSK